jgi:hypothetical protein
MITLDKIEELFNNMNSNGVNTDSEMLYGYFFTNQTPSQLEELADHLKSENYKFVDIYQDEDKLYWLRVERIEKHSPKSLFALNNELYKKAEKFNLDSYDGFDIGNKDPKKPIDRDTYAVPEEFKAADLEEGGYRLLLIGNAAFEQFPHKDEFCHFLKITTHYKTDDDLLLPSEKELDEMDNFEFFIENNLTQNGIKNYYVFRDTYKGIRHFYLVTNDKLEASNFLRFLKESGDQRKFDFEVVTDKGWTLYNDILKKLQDAD